MIDLVIICFALLMGFVVKFCFYAALKFRHAQAAESTLTRHKVTVQEMTRLWKIFGDFGIAELRPPVCHAKSKSPRFSLSDNEPFYFVRSGGERKENSTEEGEGMAHCGNGAKEMRSARISTLCTIKALNETIKADLDAYRIANAERHAYRSLMSVRSYAGADKTRESSLADALESVYRYNLGKYAWAHRMLLSPSSSSLDDKDDKEAVDKIAATN